MPLSHYALDTFVAPKLSKLTACGMPELRSNWTIEKLPTLTLSQIFTRPMPDRTNRLFFNIVRRVDAATDEYQASRNAILLYTSVPRGSIINYFRALRHTEACLAATHQSMRLAHTLLGDGIDSVFDAVTQNSVRLLYNTSKHLDERIAEGDFLQNAPVAIWLTNSGIESKDHSISFAALNEALETLVLLAEKLIDPTSSN